MNERDLKTAAQGVMAEELRRSEGHPSPEELTSYHARQLGDRDRERVRKHLAICPHCADAVLDMADFPDVEPQDPEDRVTAEDVSRSWQDFRQRVKS